LKDDPGAKLQFDWFHEKGLICPPNPELCEPYLGNIRELYGNKYDINKIPKTKEEIYKNNAKLRGGKNCRVLLDPNLALEEKDNYYTTNEKDIPKFKPQIYQSVGGKTQLKYVPMSSEEYYSIGKSISVQEGKEEQRIAREKRKLIAKGN